MKEKIRGPQTISCRRRLKQEGRNILKDEPPSTTAPKSSSHSLSQSLRKMTRLSGLRQLRLALEPKVKDIAEHSERRLDVCREYSAPRAMCPLWVAFLPRLLRSPTQRQVGNRINI